MLPVKLPPSPSYVAFQATQDGDKSHPIEDVQELVPVVLPVVSPPPPSLESTWLEYKVAKTFEQKPSTKVTLQEYEAFRVFLAEWITRPIPSYWARATDLQHCLQICPPPLILHRLEELFRTYQDLGTIYKKGKQDNMNQKELEWRRTFADRFWVIASLFSALCERDANGAIKVELYKEYYKKVIHPHFLMIQRLTNFYHLMLEKEGAKELKHPYSVLEVNPSQGLAFYRDSQGYVPILFHLDPHGIEVVYIYFGEDALPSSHEHQSKVFLVDHGKFVLKSGFIIDLRKKGGGISADISGFYGEETETPFFTSALFERFIMNSEVSVKQIRLAHLIEDDIEAFLKKPECNHDLFFIPLPAQGIESREFAYCLLQDLIVQSLNRARPEEQRQAIEWLKAIEECEGKPIKEMVDEFEGEIKANIKSEYEREVEEEQLKRSKQVSEGTTPGIKKKGISKGKKQEKPSPKESPTPPKPVDARVEEAFMEFRVKGRIKYRRMLNIAKKILKKYPDTFAVKEEKQHGSHHVLHLDEGPPASLVKPHGKKDAAISQRFANKFVDAILDQVKRSFQES